MLPQRSVPKVRKLQPIKQRSSSRHRSYYHQKVRHRQLEHQFKRLKNILRKQRYNKRTMTGKIRSTLTLTKVMTTLTLKERRSQN